MSKVWNVDVKIAGTAYIKADTAEEAREKLDQWIENEGWLELRGEAISSADLSSPFLPEVSLSPAMTLKGIYEGEKIELSFDPTEEEFE